MRSSSVPNIPNRVRILMIPPKSQYSTGETRGGILAPIFRLPCKPVSRGWTTRGDSGSALGFPEVRTTGATSVPYQSSTSSRLRMRPWAFTPKGSLALNFTCTDVILTAYFGPWLRSQVGG